ncbi:MAG TPA: cold shock domain-containing protein [Sphingobacteriaceae bacterium]
MGRSTETFSKKEKEKKRLKKQQDKREKAEERKSNNDKGKGLDEMMAYVDENGNISSTPPDQTKKRTFNTEDIQIAVARREDLPEDVIRNGTVTFFNDSKGYGFIRDHVTQESIFVHVHGLTEEVRENDKVTFETEKGLKGLNAVKVKKAVK